MMKAALCALVLLAAFPALAQQNGLPADPRAASRMPADERRLLAVVARNAATGAALGSLAETRLAGTPVAELGRVVALTHAGLEEYLNRLAGPENMPVRERLDRDETERMQILAKTDRPAFSREMLAWIGTRHPETMRAMAELARHDNRFAPLAEAALPALKQQLAAARIPPQAAMGGWMPPRRVPFQ